MHNLGQISIEEVCQLEREQDLRCRNFDPVCEKQQLNGKRCANLKGGKNEIYCWKHISDELVSMDCSE
jgi:hypothetical protein